MNLTAVPKLAELVAERRREAFVARYGDVSVELDALPVNILTERLRTEVESRLGLKALKHAQKTERVEREQLVAAHGEVGG